MKNILRENENYKVSGSLWIEHEGEKFFGPGRMELLEQIQKTGSLNKAAKAMNMSYKKAWEMISELNKQTAKPFVILQTGGKDGGGSRISEEAQEMILYYQELRKRFEKFLKKETKQLK